MGAVISERFRRSMGWFHTWAGVALASILFAVFWTGTLTVFDREIDTWMKPELRIVTPPSVALDDIVLPVLADLDIEQGSVVWIGRPSDRFPAIQLHYDDAQGASHEALLDPRTGERLELTDSHAGTEFFFPFHYMLHLPGVIGYWIVGFAAMAMLALIVSGVFIHRKIFQEFFTFRPKARARRSSLDLHNLTAVIALPFHVLMPLTGLLIFIAVYFPWSIAAPFGGDAEAFEEALLGYEYRKIEPAGEPGQPLGAIDAYVDRAEAMWSTQDRGAPHRADWIGIFNAGDVNAYVVVERYFANREVAIGPHQVVFDPQSGAVIGEFSPRPVQTASNWLEGLHWIQFDHWPLRWLYFLGGLSGCAMIASGLVFWIQARIRRGAVDPVSVRIVRAIGVASITGIVIASGAFLIANRLLPADAALGEIHRHDLEIWMFFAAWIAAFAHAALRDVAGWREQCVVIAGVAVAAAVLNWITTGDHPVAAARAALWPVAGMDAVLLAGAACALWTAYRLRKTERAQGPAPARNGDTQPIETPAE